MLEKGGNLVLTNQAFKRLIAGTLVTLTVLTGIDIYANRGANPVKKDGPNVAMLWSPGDVHLAILTKNTDQDGFTTAELLVANSDGSSKVLLKAAPENNIGKISWSADGKTLNVELSGYSSQENHGGLQQSENPV